MPRNSSGVYTLPAGNPVVSGTVVTSEWANTTLDDVAQAITDSLDRNGRGGMLSPFLFADGSELAPGLAWTNEPSTGMYRAGNGDLRVTVLGEDRVRFEDVGVPEWWDEVDSVWREILVDDPEVYQTVPPGTVDNSALRWNNSTEVWVEDERFVLATGTADDTTLKWDDTAGRWIEDGRFRLATGTTTNALMKWDGLSSSWLEDDRFRIGSGVGVTALELVGEDTTANGVVKIDFVSGTGYTLGTIGADSAGDRAMLFQQNSTADFLAFAAGGRTEDLTIRGTDGEVLIGTPTPRGVANCRLNVGGTIQASNFQFLGSNASGTAAGTFGYPLSSAFGPCMVIGGTAAGGFTDEIQFRSNSSGPGIMGRFTSAGDFSIGSAVLPAGGKVQINGELTVGTTTASDGGQINFTSRLGAKRWDIHVGTSTATPAIRIANDAGVGAEVIYGATAWSAISDVRRKHLISTIDHALAKVQKLSGYEFVYRDDERGVPRVGVSAQEVQAVLPEAVSEAEDGFLHVRYTEIIPLLVEAIKELSTVVRPREL